jgi:hypothetical protein
MSRVYIHILGAYVKFCEQKTSILVLSITINNTKTCLVQTLLFSNKF